MHTVVEMQQYLLEAKRLLGSEGMLAVVDTIAANPDIGDVMPGTGGFRKLRAARPGMGKRGGARVIYVHRSEEFPIFLFAIFAKNERANLSQSERNALRQRADKLFSEYGVKPWGTRSTS
jgi:hypothetical protein